MLDEFASLDPAEWEVLAAEARPRTHLDPEGREISIRDAVLLARRRPVIVVN